MTRSRDSQKNRLYRAEHGTFKYAREFETVREAQRWSNSVTGSRWWRALGGPSFVLIKAARADARTSTAWARSNEIKLAPSMFVRWVLLHELAHIALFHIARNGASHGPEFALIYRRMISEFLSDDERRRLDAAFEKEGVGYSTSDKRVLDALARASGTTL
jgi:hypothetical protein